MSVNLDSEPCLAQALYLALGGAGAKPDFARIGMHVARHGAQLIGGLGQWRLHTYELNIRKPAARLHRRHPAPQSNERGEALPGRLRAALFVAGTLSKLLIVRPTAGFRCRRAADCRSPSSVLWRHSDVPPGAAP